MRKILKEAGIPIPEFRLCKDFDELKSAVDNIGIPCVAKPVGGNASYGTFMIKDESDLKKLKKNYDESIEYLKKKAIDQDVFAFSPDEMDLIGIKDHVDMVTDYLVEGFMAGPEISIDAITQNGKTVTMGIADQVRMKPPYFVQLAEKMPYVCDSKTKTDIDRLVARTIEAMGIKNSASHTEIIFTPEGPKIVEIGCRIGGDNIHDFVFQTTGYNLMFESIMIALGVERKYDVKTKCHATMKYILPDKKGVIKEITVPEDVRKDPNITEIEISMKEGDTVSPPPQSFDFIGYISAKGDTPEEAEKNLTKALSSITINIGPK
jgi:biotin carboxylase